MRHTERGVTFMALAGALLGTLFILFTNFFLVYTLKLLSTGRVPVERYALITLGTVAAGSPFYWLFRRYKRRQTHLATLELADDIKEDAPVYSERDRQLVLGLTDRQGKVTLEDVTALTGLNAEQGEKLLQEVGARALTNNRSAARADDELIANVEGENPFDIDLSK